MLLLGFYKSGYVHHAPLRQDYRRVFCWRIGSRGNQCDPAHNRDMICFWCKKESLRRWNNVYYYLRFWNQQLEDLPI